jgi:hypothetical protein
MLQIKKKISGITGLVSVCLAESCHDDQMTGRRGDRRGNHPLLCPLLCATVRLLVCAITVTANKQGNCVAVQKGDHKKSCANK